MQTCSVNLSRRAPGRLNFPLHPITGIFVHQSNNVWTLRFDNEDSLGVAYNHPLYSLTAQDWRMAGELTVGETVMTRNGAVTLTQRRHLPGLHRVWNLEVRRWHNYLVREDGAVAHNSYLKSSASSEAVAKVIREIKARNPLLSDELISDELQKLGLASLNEALNKKKKLSWPEVKALFERGNKFNRKARDQRWYQFDEVTVIHPTAKYPAGHRLAGKPRRYRLDSYDPGSLRVSRKATDFNTLNEKTWRSYLAEIDRKYPNGAKIVKPGIIEIDGELLSGSKVIEIPDSNLSSSRRNFFERIAQDFNVAIKYRAE